MKYDAIVGEFNIRADANESFINPLEEFKEEAKSIFEEIQFNRYPNPSYQNLIKAFSNYIKLPEKNIVSFNGSDESLFVLINALTENNDRVMCFSPDFSMYRIYFEENKNNITDLPKKDGLYINFEKALETIEKEKIKLCLFSNPCNPTSVGVLRDEVLDFVKKADKLNCFVVVDEAYMDFWNQSIIDKINEFENLIVLKTCSKALGLAGIRVGFLISNEKIADKMREFKSPYNISVPDEKLATLILEHPKFIEKMIAKIQKSKNNLFEELKSLETKDFIVINSNTNFVYIKTSKAKQIDDFLRKNSISIRRFENTLRITCCKKEDNLEIISKIKEFLGENNEKS
ncbi:MAG: histidinol-phosphate transaminase [Clostridia bacterium]|nr:histidinol-phosphate transaminase [Clostridia bacterium]